MSRKNYSRGYKPPSRHTQGHNDRPRLPPMSSRDLAEMGHCEIRIVLDQRHGEGRTPAQSVAGRRGVREHERFHHAALATQAISDRRCFVATAVCGELSDTTVRLRLFRDACLQPFAIGRWLTRVYYRVSPGVAQQIGRSPWLRTLVRAFLDRLAKVLVP